MSALVKYAHHIKYAQKYDSEFSLLCFLFQIWLRVYFGKTRRRKTLSDLPNEAIVNILEFCDARCLCSVAITCYRFHKLADPAEELWERLIFTKFHVKKSSFRNSFQTSSKKIYLEFEAMMADLISPFKTGRLPGNLSISSSIFTTT